MPDLQRLGVSIHGRMLQLFKGILRIDGGHLSGHMFDGMIVSSAVGLTATAGGVQATSAVVTAAINQFTTVASGADGVKLPVCVAGMEIWIINDASANALQLFGSDTTADTIDTVTSATGIAVSAAKRVIVKGILSGSVAEGTQAAVPGKWVTLEGVKAT